VAGSKEKRRLTWPAGARWGERARRGVRTDPVFLLQWGSESGVSEQMAGIACSTRHRPYGACTAFPVHHHLPYGITRAAPPDRHRPDGPDRAASPVLTADAASRVRHFPCGIDRTMPSIVRIRPYCGILVARSAVLRVRRFPRDIARSTAYPPRHRRYCARTAPIVQHSPYYVTADAASESRERHCPCTTDRTAPL
jgi:hypothetical protein